MTTIDKIRAEIERRKKENMYVDLPMSIGRYYEDRDLLSFLDTLEELRESEDERIRKFLVDYFASYKIGNVTTKLNGVRIDDILAYLEKQKINTEGDFGRGYDCGYEACLNSHGAEWFEKQKEQKPETRDADDLQLLGFIYDLLNEIEWKDNWAMSKEECLRLLSNYRPQKPAEWSNKDEEMMTEIIEFLEYAYPYDNEFRIAWLKSLRGRLKSSDNWKPSEEQMEKEEDGWYLMREAKERLNAMELGISFFGNLFPYLRKRGKLDGLCKLGRRGAQRVWLYDVMGIAEKVKKGELKYKQRWI